MEVVGKMSNWTLSTSYKVTKGYPRQYLGRKAILKKKIGAPDMAVVKGLV